MNTLDIVILSINGILLLWGAWVGFVRSIFQIFAWIAAALAALFAIKTVLPADMGLVLFVGILAFIGAFFLVSNFGKFINAIVEKIPLVGTLNNLGGALIGLLKGLILSALILWTIVQIPQHPQLNDLRSDSIAIKTWTWVSDHSNLNTKSTGQ